MIVEQPRELDRHESVGHPKSPLAFGEVFPPALVINVDVIHIAFWWPLVLNVGGGHLGEEAPP